MKSHSPFRVVLWIVVMSIAAWTVIYFVQHFTSAAFQEGAMGNLFATILGVVVGIPIALEISHRQQVSQRSAAHTEREQDLVLRKRKVLSLLKDELKQNKEDVVIRRKPISDGKQRDVSTGFLSEVMWSALSDGGELHCVDDPDLLGLIAVAYHEIRSTIYLERKYMEAAFYPGGKFTLDSQDFYLKGLTAKDEDLLLAVDRAIAAIDADMRSNVSPR